MKKVPVGQTIERTYGFAFGKYLTILGIIWFPLLIMTLMILFVFMPVMKNYFAMLQVMMAQHGGPPVLPEGFGRMMWTILLTDLVMIFLYLVIRVGIAKEIMGLRDGPRFIYLSFGAAEFRVIGGYILAFLLAYAVLVAVAVVVALIAVAAGIAAGFHPQQGAAAGAMGGIAVLCIFAFELLFLYGLIRLTFFIVPVALAEQRLGLFQSWRLTRGNFWRIFVVLLAIWFPLFVIEFIAFAVLMGGKMAAIFAVAKAGHPPDIQAIMNVYLGALPWFFIGGFVFMPILYGLIGAPSVFAYMSLKEEEAAPAA